MTKAEQILDLELKLVVIESTPENYLGGLKAYISGKQTYYKPSVQKRVDSINKKLAALYDNCED
jgi:hypothetical protein